MIEIFGAIASGLIVAYAIYVAKTHRSLITYEIVSIRHDVRIEGDKIVPSGNEYLDTCINSIRLTLVNRGWKDAHNLDLHYPGIIDPFSIRKIAESINPNTIELNDKNDGLEILIKILPRNENVFIDFSYISIMSSYDDIKGAGDDYRVESIHYYNGLQSVIGAIKSIALAMVIAYFVAMGGQKIMKTVQKHSDIPQLEEPKKPAPSSSAAR